MNYVKDIAIELKEIHEFIFAESFQCTEYVYKINLHFTLLQNEIGELSFTEHYLIKDSILLDVEIFPGGYRCAFFEEDDKIIIRLPENTKIIPNAKLTFKFRWRCSLGRELNRDFIIFTKYNWTSSTETVFSTGIPQSEYYMKIPSICEMDIQGFKGTLTDLEEYFKERLELENSYNSSVNTEIISNKENGIKKIQKRRKLEKLEKDKRELKKQFIKNHSYFHKKKNAPYFEEIDGHTHYLRCKNVATDEFVGFSSSIYLNRFSKFWLIIPLIPTFFVALCFSFMILPPKFPFIMFQKILIQFNEFEVIRNIFLIFAILIAVRSWLLYRVIELQQKYVELAYSLMCTVLLVLGILLVIIR